MVQMWGKTVNQRKTKQNSNKKQLIHLVLDF